MDCVELRANIDELERELRTLKEKIKVIRESEESSKELRDALGLINSSSLDQLLKKYYLDFREQNPEIPSAVTLGERIDIRDTSGVPISAYSIMITEDDHVLIGGGGDGVYVGSYDDRGGLIMRERIDIKNAEESSASISSIVVTKDGRMLVGGAWGALYAGTYNVSSEILKQYLPRIIEKGESGEQ